MNNFSAAADLVSVLDLPMGSSVASQEAQPVLGLHSVYLLPH